MIAYAQDPTTEVDTPALGRAFDEAAEITDADVKQLIDNVEKKGETPVTFNIHKYMGDPVVDQPTYNGGQALQNAPKLDGAEGVEFRVRKVNNIDLTTVAGWKQYSELMNKNQPSDTNLGPERTLTTNADGLAQGDFSVGVYYVEETGTPAGATAIAPFYIALPLPLTTGTGDNQAVTGWNNDVHVYPKNQEVSGSKTVDDSRAYAGENVKYTVTGEVPAVPASGTFDGYDVIDDYDETGVDIIFDSLKVSVTGGSTPLVLAEGSDYTLQQGDGKFAVSLTSAGSTKLAEARKTGGAATKVQLEYEGKLKEGAVLGAATNKATIVPPDTSKPDPETKRPPINPDNPNDNPIPPVIQIPEVQTVLGQITIEKTGDKGAPLSGAEFQLYRCEQGTTKTTHGPISVNGTNTWTTSGENGSVTLPAIQVEDFYDNEGQEDNFDYCVVETKAPAGYALLPKPVTASITQANPNTTIKVENVKDNTSINLPSTGERGTLFAIIGGGLLALLAAIYFARRNRTA